MVGPQKWGKSGDTLREEVDCPPGWFAINGGYLTSGIVVSTWKNFAVRHPDGAAPCQQIPQTSEPCIPKLRQHVRSLLEKRSWASDHPEGQYLKCDFGQSHGPPQGIGVEMGR